jgi:putative DNA primase/helicase
MDGGFPNLDDAKASAVASTSKRRRVRGQVDEAKSPSDGPVIQVVAGKLHITTTAAEDALIASGLPIYQRGDGLVQPVVREVPASRGRTTLAAGLGEMNAYSLVDLMCATAEYERYDARSEAWVRINPPTQIAQTLLSRQGKWRFPVVAGIITTPTLRPDGSLLTAPGYDAATRLYHVADPSLRLHPDVAAPSRDLAKRALKELETLLREFSFVSDVAKAVALSGIITPIVRGAMSVAPLHAVNAHAAGSGKSFLVDLISLISTGRICPVASAAPDEAETEKRIAGLLLAGYPIVSIDNCNGELGGDLLCQAIERPLIRIRRLGGSDIFEIESSVTMFATGNNLRVRGDMVRRSLVAEIDPQMERPELRKFDHDPVAAILADRGRYVSACLIIVRAYILAGSPGKFDPIASFGGWSDLVRSALVWLGCSDPALSMEAAREDDPELSELREMISVWRAAFGSVSTTCKAAIAAMTEKVAKPDDDGEASQYASKTEIRYPDLQPMFLQVAGVRGSVDAKKLGTWLKNREGKIVGKDRFERDGMTDGAARWKLRSVDQNRNTRG